MEDQRITQSLETRVLSSMKIKEKYPGRIPIIIMKGTLDTPFRLERNKFIVSQDVAFGKIAIDIRKEISNLSPSQALFYMVNNTLLSHSSLMSQIYSKYADPDGFLYITCYSENTFG
jgi:GABA(A) receptor-associated protein